MAGDEWDPRALPDLSGRTYLITGANRGLGFFASDQLARAGATVLMTGRNPNRLAAARAAIERRVADAAAGRSESASERGASAAASGVVETLLLDTSNLGSVRSAAATARGRRRLDGVLLNAGIVHAPRHRETTPDGHEVVFATNVLGHFALAGELLTPLAAALGRMVWIGSLSTAISPYDPVDPQLTKGYSSWRAYVQSKVAAGAIGFEADRRLRAVGIPVKSVVAHPGYSTSGRTPRIRGVNEPTRLTRFGDNLQAGFSQSKERGAWPLVRALADPDVVGGQFWGPRSRVRGEPRLAAPPRIVQNEEIAARLWTVCEEATGMRWPQSKGARGSRR